MAEQAEMRQATLASVSFDKHSKQTRRAKFLAEMDQVVPWRELCALIQPFYPKAGNGRPPIGQERMLRLQSASRLARPEGGWRAYNGRHHHRRCQLD